MPRDDGLWLSVEYVVEDEIESDTKMHGATKRYPIFPVTRL
jgi:hypothetical protein